MDEDLTDLMEGIRNTLMQCLERGMKMPSILCAISANGSLYAIRTDGQNPEVLAEHTDGSGFVTPINIIVVDQTGDAARITIGPHGATFH